MIIVLRAADDQRPHRQRDRGCGRRPALSAPTAVSARRRTSRRHRAPKKPSLTVISSRSPSVISRRPCRGACAAADAGGLLQLDQHAVRRRGMNEGDQRAFGAGPRALVDQPGAARLQLRQRGGDVLDAEGDVVQPRAALLHERRDRRVGRGRFEQLEAGFADRHEVRAHALRWHLFRRFDLQAERVAVERERGVEILHRDADVIEDGFHTSTAGTPCPTPSARRIGLQTGPHRQRVGSGVRIELARGDAHRRPPPVRPAPARPARGAA